MDAVEFRCSACGKLLKVPAARAGSSGKCPYCNERVQVPYGAAADGRAVGDESFPEAKVEAAALPGALAEPAVADTYAGFWRRGGACIVDSIIILGAFWGYRIVTGVGRQILIPVIFSLYFAVLHSSSHQATFGKRAFGLVVTDTRGNRVSFWRAWLRFVAMFVYPVAGGFALGVVLPDALDDRVRIAVVLFWLLGVACFAMAGFTRRKQALHDFLAGTLVLRAGVKRVVAGEAIEFACLGCGRRLRVPLTDAGKVVMCNGCNAEIRVPVAVSADR